MTGRPTTPVSRRRMSRVALVVGLLLVLLVTILVAGRQAGAPPPTLADGSVRLGPEPDDNVAAYLAGLPALLPAAGAGAVPALVQFGAELDEQATLAAVAGAQPVQVVFRVPLSRVQTALRFQQLGSAGDPVAAAREIDYARQRAAREASREASARTGRAATVAAVEARTLVAPCRCVLAVLVQGDRAALDAIRTRPGVRAVHAAPPGTDPRTVAVSPLLPEQLTAVTAAPDDGPVPGG